LGYSDISAGATSGRELERQPGRISFPAPNLSTHDQIGLTVLEVGSATKRQSQEVVDLKEKSSCKSTKAL
jgi:hypothetical protein